MEQEEVGAGLDVANGTTLNGPVLNGQTLNGETLNGKRIGGSGSNGPGLNGLTLSGSQVLARRTSGYTAPLAVGDRIDAALDSGETVSIYVVGQGEAEPVETVLTDVGPEAGVVENHTYSYTLEWADRYGLRHPYCPNGGAAIALQGRWDPVTGRKAGPDDWNYDPDAITLACQGYALYKCAVFYAPWSEWFGGWSDTYPQGWHTQQIALPQYHQACVRAIRADYCGTGTPYTQDGTLIDLADYAAPFWISNGHYVPPSTSSASPTGGWAIEAEWTPSGATCLQTPRRPELRDSIPCLRDRCYSDPAAGAVLLFTRVPTNSY